MNLRKFMARDVIISGSLDSRVGKHGAYRFQPTGMGAMLLEVPVTPSGKPVKCRESMDARETGGVESWDIVWDMVSAQGKTGAEFKIDGSDAFI
jgi:hypothetical protein